MGTNKIQSIIKNNSTFFIFYLIWELLNVFFLSISHCTWKVGMYYPQLFFPFSGYPDYFYDHEKNIGTLLIYTYDYTEFLVYSAIPLIGLYIFLRSKDSKHESSITYTVKTQTPSRDVETNNPNIWLHPTDGTNAGETLGEHKSINDRFAHANTFENSTSNKGPQTNDNIVDYQQKKIALDKLKEQGLIGKEDYDIKSKEIQNEESKIRTGNRIALLKNELLNSVEDARKAGVLTTMEAIMKKKEIHDSFYCIICKYSQKEDFKFCPQCGSRV